MKKTFINILKVILPLILGSFIGFLTKDNFSYLDTLQRKIILPPIVFIIVWSILYVLMGLWYYFYEKDFKEDKKTIALYYFSLAINLSFTPILFIFHNIILALINVLSLLVIIMILFFKTLLKNKKYAYLLVPYILWLLLATTLVIDLLIHN